MSRGSASHSQHHKTNSRDTAAAATIVSFPARRIRPPVRGSWGYSPSLPVRANVPVSRATASHSQHHKTNSRDTAAVATIVSFRARPIRPPVRGSWGRSPSLSRLTGTFALPCPADGRAHARPPGVTTARRYKFAWWKCRHAPTSPEWRGGPPRLRVDEWQTSAGANAA